MERQKFESGVMGQMVHLNAVKFCKTFVELYRSVRVNLENDENKTLIVFTLFKMDIWLKNLYDFIFYQK